MNRRNFLQTLGGIGAVFPVALAGTSKKAGILPAPENVKVNEAFPVNCLYIANKIPILLDKKLQGLKPSQLIHLDTNMPLPERGVFFKIPIYGTWAMVQGVQAQVSLTDIRALKNSDKNYIGGTAVQKNSHHFFLQEDKELNKNVPMDLFVAQNLAYTIYHFLWTSITQAHRHYNLAFFCFRKCIVEIYGSDGVFASMDYVLAEV